MTKLRLILSTFTLLATSTSALAYTHIAPIWQDSTDKKTEKKAAKKDGLPLESERNISFETDEGTWMSLDVSPDGNTVVFELLGDIYTMPITGGEATAIVTGMAFQSQPAYSPDGKYITYLSDESGADNVWIADVDGKNPKKLTTVNDGLMNSPTWSADSQYVLVSKVDKGIGAAEAWMYHINGGKGVQVTKKAPTPTTPRSQQRNVMGLSASSDGKYLYYATARGGFSYNMKSFPWSIVRHDLNEGTVDTLITGYGGAIRPEISPDGTKLVYATRHETETGLRIRDLIAGTDEWLAYPVTRDDQESRSTRDSFPGYSFTPDGRAILVTAGGKFERIEIADGSRSVIPFNAKVDLGVGPNLVNQKPDNTGPVVVRMAETPTLSPGGNVVLFSALGELYSMNLQTDTTPNKIMRAGTNVYQPSWSRDGRWMTYISWDEYGGGDIYRMRTDGSGKPEKLTTRKGYYSDPHFTPDGKEIVAFRSPNHQFDIGNEGAQRDLIAIPAAGGNARVITPSSRASTIHFGDAMDRVYLYNGVVYSIRLDGTDRRDHLIIKGKGFYNSIAPINADEIKLSPNGKYALAKVEQQLHLITVPQLGRKAITMNVASASTPLKKITDIGVDSFSWSNDGQTMVWSVGSTLYTQKITDVEWVAPKKKEEEKPESTELASADDVVDQNDTDDAKDKAAMASEEKSDEKAKEAEKPKPYKTYALRVEVPRDNPEGLLLLTGATVITMGPEGTIENADVLVENGKIKAVGAKGSLSTPKKVDTMDMSGKFITPGFVDTHGHWHNWNRVGVKSKYFWPYLANLSYGVTSGLDVQTGETGIFVSQDMVEAGRLIGLRPWSTGPGVFSDNNMKSKEHAKDILTRYRDHYRTKNIKAYISGNRKQRQYIIQASKELGMMPTTEGGLDLKLDLTHIIDGFAGNEHALPITPLYKDVIELTAQSGIGYTPTLLVTFGGPFAEEYWFTRMNPHDDEKLNRFTPHHIIDQKTKRRNWFRDEEFNFDEVAASALKIQRAGGKIGMGSHGQLDGLGYHWEMWSFAAGNATPMEVLKAATIDGAHIIGHEQEVGSLEPGKFADLVILNSDPREDIKNTTDIHRVMMNGRLYNDDTMDEEWPRKRTLPKLWFHDLGPNDKK